MAHNIGEDPALDHGEERYEGERRGLTLFLQELQPLAAECLGHDHLLAYAIDKTLAEPSLARLRHCKQLFNSLPRMTRQELSKGIVAQPEPEPPAGVLLEKYRENEPTAFVSISNADDRNGDGPWRIELAHELLDAPDLRVLIRPGTLPSTAARSLRDIADRLEKDRRLLSERHWRAEHLREVTDQSGVDVG